MEELKLDYYFKEMDKFTFKEVFVGCTYPWEALEKAKGTYGRFADGSKYIDPREE